MQLSELLLLRYFSKNEKGYDGKPVDWADYHFVTMQELDRIRHEVGTDRASRCVLIRGSHGYLKETAVDAVFPEAPFQRVVMALFRSGFSKGLYEGGSIHLDMRMGPSGLARCWLAFKPERRAAIQKKGLGTLRSYSNDGWDYYQWSHPRAWELLAYLVGLNQSVPDPTTPAVEMT